MVGPISYRETMCYSDDMELGPNSREFLWDVVKCVDVAFIGFLNDKMRQDKERIKAQVPRPKELPGG